MLLPTSLKTTETNLNLRTYATWLDKPSWIFADTIFKGLSALAMHHCEQLWKAESAFADMCTDVTGDPAGPFKHASALQHTMLKQVLSQAFFHFQH